MLALLLAACGSPSQNVSEKSAPSDSPKRLAFVVKSTLQDGKLSTLVDTNLPDGVELTSSLSKGSGLNYYRASSEAKVKGGIATFDSFSNHGKSLDPGKYALTVSAPLSRVQSPDVRSRIGDDYKNYFGAPLVARKGQGELEGAWINVEKTVTVE